MTSAGVCASASRSGTITTGLIAYLDGESVGWCAVEPRAAYERLRYLRTPWTGRDEDRDDATVWAITCFVTRVGYRKRGVTYALATAAVDFARERGAAALEGYTMITEPGQELTWGELHVGALSVYEEAGLREVSLPSKQRVVTRVDFSLKGECAAEGERDGLGFPRERSSRSRRGSSMRPSASRTGVRWPRSRARTSAPGPAWRPG